MANTNIVLMMGSLPSRFELPGRHIKVNAILQSVEFSEGAEILLFTRNDVSCH